MLRYGAFILWLVHLIMDSDSPEQRIPPGWYDDPAMPGVGWYRWWSGKEWTTHRTRKLPDPGWYPDTQTGTSRWWNGTQWTGKMHPEQAPADQASQIQPKISADADPAGEQSTLIPRTDQIDRQENISWIDELRAKQQKEQRGERDLVRILSRGKAQAGSLFRDRSTREPVPARWIDEDEVIEIQGFELRGGNFYYGAHMPAVKESAVSDPALINPVLPIDIESPLFAASDLGYWPSYKKLTPQQRGIYLKWLARGRSGHIPTGYVFLYYYGLERRLLYDAEHDVGISTDALIGEVQRLHREYSLGTYASSLIEYMELSAGEFSVAGELPPDFRKPKHSGISLRSETALATLAHTQASLSPGWAFALRMETQSKLRTAAVRCPKEFYLLFIARYREQFPVGIPLSPKRGAPLTIKYRCASAGMPSVVTSTRDIAACDNLEHIAELLLHLSEICTDELGAYSRWIKKYPDRKESAQAHAFLPAAVVEHKCSSELDKIRAWLQQTIGEDSALACSTDLINHFLGAEAGRDLDKRESTEANLLLEKLGYGIEPDMRFYGSPIKLGSPVVIFTLVGDDPHTPSSEYSLAALTLHLAAAVATAETAASNKEFRHMEQHLEHSPGLSAGERLRLIAHMQLLAATNPSVARLKKRIERLSENEREHIGNFLITVVGIDGWIGADEISMLGKIYTLLGLDSDSIPSKIHQLGTGQEKAVKFTPGSAIASEPDPSQPPKDSKPTITIDRDRLDAIRRQTTAVSGLISSVTDDENEQPFAGGTAALGNLAPPAIEPSVTPLIDGKHHQFLTALSRQEEWESYQVEAFAETYGVFAEGALEILQDAADKITDEPLCSYDGEILELDLAITQQLLHG